MNKLKSFCLMCGLMTLLFGCDARTDNNSTVASSSPIAVKSNIFSVKSNGGNDSGFIYQSGDIDNSTFPCLNRSFAIKVMHIQGNTVTFGIVNASTEAISARRASEIELRPIKNGKPIQLRSKVVVARVNGEELIPIKLYESIYPEEKIVVTQEMPSPFTGCEDYALAYVNHTCNIGEQQFVRLGSVVDCSSSVK